MTISSAVPIRPALHRPALPDVETRMREIADELGAAYRPIYTTAHAFEIATRPGRTQVVYLDVDRSGALARLSSRIGRFNSALPARTLLARNAATLVGSICVEDVSGSPHLMLKAQCRMEHSAVLRQTLALSAWTADELERDLFGHDVE